MIADPEYTVYDKFGIGQLGYGGLFSMSMVTELRSLAAQGIKNTTTGEGSNRWQNSGAYSALDCSVPSARSLSPQAALPLTTAALCAGERLQSMLVTCATTRRQSNQSRRRNLLSIAMYTGLPGMRRVYKIEFRPRLPTNNLPSCRGKRKE